MITHYSPLGPPQQNGRRRLFPDGTPPQCLKAPYDPSGPKIAFLFLWGQVRPKEQGKNDVFWALLSMF
jgi:hypothetical protein